MIQDSCAHCFASPKDFIRVDYYGKAFLLCKGCHKRWALRREQFEREEATRRKREESSVWEMLKSLWRYQRPSPE